MASEASWGSSIVRLSMRRTLARCGPERFDILGVIETEILLPRLDLKLCQGIKIGAVESCAAGCSLASASDLFGVIAREDLEEFIRSKCGTSPALGLFENCAIARDDGQSPRRGAVVDHLGDDGVGRGLRS